MGKTEVTSLNWRNHAVTPLPRFDGVRLPCSCPKA